MTTKHYGWRGLTKGQARELAREFVAAIGAANCVEALPSEAWLDVRLRALGCPDDQLAEWRGRIESMPLMGVADGAA
jgi:hypothetical protein